MAWLLLFALSLLALSSLRDRSREHLLGSDEPEWLAISVLHVQQLVEGGAAPGSELPAPGEEPSFNRWMNGVQRTTFGYMNPCLGKLIWGGVLRAAGHGEASPLVFQSFHRDDLAAGQRARDELLPGLPLARRVVLCFAALTSTLLFWVAKRAAPNPGASAGVLCGAIAWGLFVFSPLVHRTSSYLRTDYFMLFFLLATLLWVLREREVLFGGAARGKSRWRFVASAVITGAFLGLALSAKLNGSLAAMGLVAAGLGCALLEGRGLSPAERRARCARALLAIVIAGATACALFILLQPVTWADPIEGAREILARWERHTGFIQNTWAPRTGVEIVTTPWERISLFARKLFGQHEPFVAATGIPLGAVLSSLGLAVLLRRSQAAVVHSAFYVVMLVGTALSLPIDWERLFLPALVAVVSLEAIAVSWMLGRVLPARER